MPNDGDADTIDETQFTCPRCGGHKFGTTLDMAAMDDASRQTGHCHRPCGFSWPRSDDAKYFTPTGRKHARTYVGTVVTE